MAKQRRPTERVQYEKPVFARRVTLYSRADGMVGYKVQAKNWSTLEGTESTNEVFTSVKRAQQAMAKRYPGIEIVDRTA